MFRRLFILLFLCTTVFAGSATNITGLYYTGINSSYGLLPAGTQDPNWTVTYASINGGNSVSSMYEGQAYVVSPASVAGSDYIQNTNSAQWITAPGATVGVGGAANAGGDFLPGNGSYGQNEGIYVYTLAFNIIGTGTVGSVVTNKVSISLTIASDDQYKVYVNPSLYSDHSINGSSTAAFSGTSAWTNTTMGTLQNYGGGNNATFVIGTNYLTVEVDNTNSIVGRSYATDWNASGLLVYQVGGVATIDGRVIPESSTYGAWFFGGMLGLVGIIRFRTKRIDRTIKTVIVIRI